MIKKFCDVCGKEIIKENEVWTNILTAQEGNSRVSFDETIIDMCEACATHIHCVTSMMKHGWVPEYGNEKTLDNVHKVEKELIQLN